MSSLKFVVSSLDVIAASKEATKNKDLADSIQTALTAIKENDPGYPDPEVIFAPLRLATKRATASGNIQVLTESLQCIGQLISYSYFSAPNVHSVEPEGASEDAADLAPLIERAIDTICDCFQGEVTPVETQRQIVKSLLSAVLNDKIVVHGAGLLKAVRTVYNVFLLSRNSANQQIAQGTLTQMVGTVFERVKNRLHMKEARMSLTKLKQNGSNATFDPPDSPNVIVGNAGEDTLDGASVTTPSEPPTEGGGKLTLKDLEHRKSFDDSNMGEGAIPTTVTQARPPPRGARSVSDQSTLGENGEESQEDMEAEDEVYIRDAYVVFRSFCNLSIKVLPADQLYDLRGQPMRSKMISLHLIHTLINNNISVFTSPLCTITNTKSNEPTSFLQAIKYYLCFSITRNGASSVDRVFEVCCDIFWLMLKYTRASFKVGCEFTRLLGTALTLMNRKRLRSSSMRYISRSCVGRTRQLPKSSTLSRFSTDSVETLEPLSKRT